MRVLSALVVTAMAGGAWAQDREPDERSGNVEPARPGPGVFLVAKPSIEGGPFFHSVVLLVSHGDSGTLGLIVNRATEVSLEEALPDLSEGAKEPHSLFFGGPVALNGLLFLFRTADPPRKAAHIMGDVYFASDGEILKKLLEKGLEPERKLRLYLGHAGWAPGQLDTEILRGDWTVLRADAFTLFQKDPARMWTELAEGGRVVAGLDLATGVTTLETRLPETRAR